MSIDKVSHATPREEVTGAMIKGCMTGNKTNSQDSLLILGMFHSGIRSQLIVQHSFS